jgi:tetratricopeptide (TPR) repeat protein
MSQSRLEKILKLYQEDPGNSFLIYALALEYKAENDLDLSLQYFEKLQNLDPEYLGLYYPLSGIYARLGYKDLAIKSVLKGMELAEKQNNLKTRGELEQWYHSLLESET